MSAYVKANSFVHAVAEQNEIDLAKDRHLRHLEIRNS